MKFALNFDIFFAIAFVALTFSAIFKKTKKISLNFWLFLVTTLTVGLLVYFKVDVKLYEAIQTSLAPLISKLPNNIMQERYLGLWYFGLLLIVDLVLFLLLKLIFSLFVNDHFKFKRDINYTSKHIGTVNFLTSVLQFTLFSILLLIVFNFANTRFGFVTENSYLINFFNKTFEPVLDLLRQRGKDFFSLFGF